MVFIALHVEKHAALCKSELPSSTVKYKQQSAFIITDSSVSISKQCEQNFLWVKYTITGSIAVTFFRWI